MAKSCWILVYKGIKNTDLKRNTKYHIFAAVETIGCALAQPTHSLITPTPWISSTLYSSHQVSLSFFREYPSQANAYLKGFASLSFSNSEISARQFSYNCFVSAGFPRVSLISPRQIMFRIP